MVGTSTLQELRTVEPDLVLVCVLCVVCSVSAQHRVILCINENDFACGALSMPMHSKWIFEHECIDLRLMARGDVYRNRKKNILHNHLYCAVSKTTTIWSFFHLKNKTQKKKN